MDWIGYLRRIMNKDASETFAPSTDSLEALRDFLATGTPLTFGGTVTAIPGANQFTIPTLAGLGAGKFADANAPWWALVFRDADGAGASPQGEMQAITTYVTATGDFTTAAFTAAVAIGDEIILLNPVLAAIGRRIDAATLDDMSALATASLTAEVKRVLLRLSTNAFTADIQGAARTELDTMLYTLATYISALGAAYSATVNPGGAAKTNIEQTLEDLGDMLAGAGITSYPAAAPPGDGISFAEVLRQIYNDVIALTGAGVLHEQADVPFNVNAALVEANIFDLSVANTRYVVRSLRLKCVDPGAETVTVRLYELVNNALTLVDSFAITTANFATYHSLMDMFGLPHLTGDNLKVAVIATAAGPYACTGQYCTATATI